MLCFISKIFHRYRQRAKEDIIELDNTRMFAFEFQSERVKTFKSWHSKTISANRMAMAGFYYVKFEDVVRCHICKTEYGFWTEDIDPYEHHMRWSLGCDWLRHNVSDCVDISKQQFKELLNSSDYDLCTYYHLINFVRPTLNSETTLH